MGQYDVVIPTRQDQLCAAVQPEAAMPKAAITKPKIATTAAADWNFVNVSRK